MSDNVHPVVRLLAKRMESHPEEFGSNGNGRWAILINDLMKVATDEEKLLLRTPFISEIHEAVMDELLNGDERREEERRRIEEAEKQRALSLQAQLQRQQLYGNQYGGVGGAGAVNQYDQYQQLGLGVSSPMLQGISTSATTALNIGGETLDAGMIQKMKKALGL